MLVGRYCLSRSVRWTRKWNFRKHPIVHSSRVEYCCRFLLFLALAEVDSWCIEQMETWSYIYAAFIKTYCPRQLDNGLLVDFHWAFQIFNQENFDWKFQSFKKSRYVETAACTTASTYNNRIFIRKCIVEACTCKIDQLFRYTSRQQNRIYRT